MRRPGRPALSAAWLFLLVTVLLVFGALADRALVGQAKAARAAALDGVDEATRLTALSVRATLAQVEQAVAAGRPIEGVSTDRLALPPSRLPFHGAPPPYGGRPRTDLVKLLDSTSTTPGGLPEAVVARLALGVAPRGPGAANESDDVVERLLSGRLPVLPEDLPYLARALGVPADSRIAPLQERLRQAPDGTSIPMLPAFRRALTGASSRLPVVEGWSRSGTDRIRYGIDVTILLARAGVASRATVAPANPAANADHRDDPLRRVVPVPEVDGLSLSVAVDAPGGLRLRALRASLWTAVVCSCLGLVVVRRALDREARATAREKRFLAGVTHELRTPLAAIRVFGETLAEGRGDPRAYGLLVARESERLETLVERVLAVTRVDEAVRFAPTRPAEVVRSALELIASRAARRSVTIRFVAEAEAAGAAGQTLEALWDADAVRRALLNLLENAVAHGREGGNVDVFLEDVDGSFRIAVRDDGPGIGRRHHAGLFHRFFRGESEAPGTGLGLYLVDQVARAHGGRVDLVTEVGKGATFTLVLPRVPAGAEGGSR